MMKEPVNMFKDKKFLKEIAIILIVGAIVNGACFLLCSLTGHCATINSVLPYLCQSENSYYDELAVQNALSLIDQKYPSDDIYNKKFFVCLAPYTVWYTYSDYIEVPCYYVYVCPDNLNLPTTWAQNSTFENFQFNNSDFYIDVNLGNYDRYLVYPQSIQSGGYGITKFNGGIVRLFGQLNIHQISNSYFEVTVPGLNYPVYTTSQFTTVDRTTIEGYVLAFADTIVNTGEFTDLPPLENILNNITNSWNDSTPTTLPNTDSNASVSDNLRNFLSTMQSNLANSINNLGSNIKSYFDKLQQKLTDTTNAILGGIHNGFATLNQNFKDFFGAKLDAILNKLDYFQEPFSSQDLADNLNNANFSSDFLGLISTVGTFSTAFTSGSEPSSCSFTLDFSNSYYNFGVCEFSLNWILPFRPTIRLIVGCLCVYSLIVSIFTSLNTYIGGTSSINDDI